MFVSVFTEMFLFSLISFRLALLWFGVLSGLVSLIPTSHYNNELTTRFIRCKMLNNRFAGKVLSYLDQLYEAGITMNGQIVLCKGWNDKEELERIIAENALLSAEVATLNTSNCALSSENDMLRLKLEHKEELLALHNYYNKIRA